MWMLQCDCGFIVRGKNDDEVLKKAGEHAMKDHPEIKLTTGLEKAARAKISDG